MVVVANALLQPSTSLTAGIWDISVVTTNFAPINGNIFGSLFVTRNGVRSSAQTNMFLSYTVFDSDIAQTAYRPEFEDWLLHVAS
jgi:hypothetical protein